MSPEERGDLAERLVGVALQLVAAVHDDGVEQVAWVLEAVQPADLPALAVVLAAMVDPERSVTALLGWVTFDEYGFTLEPADVRAFSDEQVRVLHAQHRRGENSTLSAAGFREWDRRRSKRYRDRGLV